MYYREVCYIDINLDVSIKTSINCCIGITTVFLPAQNPTPQTLIRNRAEENQPWKPTKLMWHPLSILLFIYSRVPVCSRFCSGLLWLSSRAVKNNCSSVKITWAYSTSWDRCRKKLLTQTHYFRSVLRSECEFLQLMAMYFFSTGIEILVLHRRCQYSLVFFPFIYDQEFLSWCCIIQIRNYELISVTWLAILFNAPCLKEQYHRLRMSR